MKATPDRKRGRKGLVQKLLTTVIRSSRSSQGCRSRKSRIIFCKSSIGGPRRMASYFLDTICARDGVVGGSKAKGRFRETSLKPRWLCRMLGSHCLPRPQQRA